MKQIKPIQRRQFMQRASLASVSIFVPQISFISRQGNAPDPYEQLKSGRYLAKVKVETRISDTAIFTEGPAVDHLGNVYFTNIPVNKILIWNPDTEELTVFRTDLQGANGLRFTMDGNLLACEGDTGKVVSIDMKSGKVSTVADHFETKSLQSPNDLDFDSKGRIYFSSRTNNPDLQKENVRALYRVDPGGEIHQLLAEPKVHMPNGVVISPDEKTLYLIEAHPDADHHRNILAFNLGTDGSITNQRTLYNFYPGRSGDGMCIDKEGNLYVAAGLHKERGTSETLVTRPGIHVISPTGNLLAFRETPEDAITNCTFGGKDLKTLYITCKSYLLSIRTKIPGKSSYRPNG
jgi:gluconolactonase